MDDDEISSLIAKDIAGALFEISHQNYPLAAKIIRQIKEQSALHNRPISIIQDVSNMEDPLDLQFGLRSGVDWVATDRPEHVRLSKGFNKLPGVIFKGRDLPKRLRVDSVMADGFLDPDAEVIGMQNGQIKHLISEHPDQRVLDALADILSYAATSAIAVSDLDLAKALSFRRASKKIFFAPKDKSAAARGGIYWGVYPIYMGNDLISSLKNTRFVKKGERMVDATNIKHVAIHSIP